VGEADDIREKLEAIRRRGGGDPAPEAVVEALRRRLREKVDSAAAKAPPAEIVYRRDLPQTRPAPPPRPAPAGPPVVLAEAIGGEEFVAPGGGKGFLITTPVAELGETWPLLCDTCRDAFAEPSSPPVQLLRALRGGRAPRLDDLLFMDTETTGLGSTPVFLVGAMTWEHDGLVVRQFFARDYAEERAIVSAFLDFAAGRLLVTFNGKSFDVPYLRARAAVNALLFDLDAAPHLDLLHAARRFWGRQVPDCRLQTLEALICGRRRHGDIPGHQIPDAYHDFVRTGDAVRMVEVIHHNTLDLLTLADLLTRLSADDGAGGER
jgi:hypothetical protein